MTDVTASDWWKSAVVYQIYPRSFADSDGDGIGDLRGIIGRLDYLAELGVDVVWLSPAYRSPQDDNGYDISDYQDIDPVFGTLADLDALIAGLHERGIRLVMDLVVNHTSDEHPWFVESRSSVDSPKRDWYWWRPARPGHEPGTRGAEPTNWKSFFSGPTWEFDESTGEYYLHLFTRRQPDLNWENPEVRRAVHAMMNWWVARGIDGFRMDVINLISKDVAPDGSLADGVVPDGDWLGAGWPLVANGPRVHEFLHEMNLAVLAGRNLITVGETPGVSIADAVRYTDPARGEVDMVFQFEHMNLDQVPGGDKWDLAPLRLTDLKRNLAAWQQGLAATGWNSLYWDNHDQPRIVSRWGDDGEHRVVSAKTLATVLHLMRGTPYVYQGEELGMTNAHFTSLGQYRDVEAVNYAAEAAERGIAESTVLRSLSVKSRDNARTPMQWDAGPNGGFTTGVPWIEVNANHVDVNAEAALADPDSVFHHYRRLIGLRHEHPVIVDGDFRMLLPDDEQVFAYTRTLDARTLLVLANVTGSAVAVDIGPEAGLLGGTVLIGTHPGGGPNVTGSVVSLRAWESLAILQG
jgi:oligo-1,6-glucosidase